MGAVNFGINKELVNKIVDNYNVENFIETGTYLGDTSDWASTKFNHVYTIEISKPLYKQAKKRFKSNNKVHVYFGDSKMIMPEVVAKLSGPALYWLDGHWCGRNTGGKYNECPIMYELEEAVKHKGSIIFIDDYKYFLGPNPHDHGENYPILQTIIQFLFTKLPNHYLTFHDDTIICVPAELKTIVDEDWKENYGKRFPMTFKSLASKILWRIKNFDFTPESKRK